MRGRRSRRRRRLTPRAGRRVPAQRPQPRARTAARREAVPLVRRRRHGPLDPPLPGRIGQPREQGIVRTKVRPHARVRARGATGRRAVHRSERHQSHLGRPHPSARQESVRVAQPRLAVLGDPIQKHRQQRRQVPRRPVTRDVRVRQRVRARTGTGLTNERTVRL